MAPDGDELGPEAVDDEEAEDELDTAEVLLVVPDDDGCDEDRVAELAVLPELEPCEAVGTDADVGCEDDFEDKA